MCSIRIMYSMEILVHTPELHCAYPDKGHTLHKEYHMYLIYIYIRSSMFVRTLQYFFRLKKGGTFFSSEKSIPICSASTQVTTTTLQKNLTEKIKWYMLIIYYIVSRYSSQEMSLVHKIPWLMQNTS